MTHNGCPKYLSSLRVRQSTQRVLTTDFDGTSYDKFLVPHRPNEWTVDLVFGETVLLRDTWPLHRSWREKVRVSKEEKGHKLHSSNAPGNTHLISPTLFQHTHYLRNLVHTRTITVGEDWQKGSVTRTNDVKREGIDNPRGFCKDTLEENTVLVRWGRYVNTSDTRKLSPHRPPLTQNRKPRLSVSWTQTPICRSMDLVRHRGRPEVKGKLSDLPRYTIYYLHPLYWLPFLHCTNQSRPDRSPTHRRKPVLFTQRNVTFILKSTT